MDINTIREAVRRVPVKPFALQMNDGRSFYIPHPEYLAVSRRVVLVIDHATEAGLHLEPILVASIKYEGQPPSLPAAEPTTGGTP